MARSAKSVHGDVASFVAGALPPDEDDAFAEHLADCAECRDEIVWMSQLAVAVSELDTEADTEATVTPLRPWQTRKIVLAAAGATLFALGGAAGYTVDHSTHQDATQVLFDTGAVHSAAKDQVSAQVAVVPSEGGVQIGLHLVDPVGPKNCELVAIGRDGEEQTAMTWHVPDGGFGAGPARELSARGQAGLQLNQIARFEIRSEGRTILAITA